jgi:hypothetical protein
LTTNAGCHIILSYGIIAGFSSIIPELRRGGVRVRLLPLRKADLSVALSLLAFVPLLHAGVCVGGPNAGKACTKDSDCPQGACAGFKPGPARGGNDTSCPPGPGNTKATPDPAKGDKDVDGDGTLDFFMGEWKFVTVNGNDVKDTIVRRWCINRPRAGDHFGDFFSFEVLTSSGAPGNVAELQKVKPDTPT